MEDLISFWIENKPSTAKRFQGQFPLWINPDNQWPPSPPPPIMLGQSVQKKQFCTFDSTYFYRRPPRNKFQSVHHYGQYPRMYYMKSDLFRTLGNKGIAFRFSLESCFAPVTWTVPSASLITQDYHQKHEQNNE